MYASKHRIALLSVSLATAVGVAMVAGQTRESPEALFQYATITGSANAINAVRIPVVTGSGQTSYKDVTIRFEVDSAGNLAFAPEGSQVVDAQPMVVSGFKAGSYAGPGSVYGGKMLAAVEGPSALPGGAESWSFGAVAGADRCTFPSSATWYVGRLESNPVFERLKKAGITSTAWSYGVANGPDFNDRCTDTSQVSFPSWRWRTGTLIGVSQSGNAITISSFTDTSTDSAAPVAQVTYRIVP